jgi:hypothetical protein
MAGSPKSHLWDYLDYPGEDPGGYALYTYVLLKSNDTSSIAFKKFMGINQIISWSVVKADEYKEDFDKSQFNLFLFPDVFVQDSQGITLNQTLSKSILTSIAVSVEDERLRDLINSNPGPFLISTSEAISAEQVNKDLELLYVDLTRSNMDALPEIVAAYKKRITSDQVEGVEPFASIRISLLNLMLDADDYIRQVRVSYLGWINH